MDIEELRNRFTYHPPKDIGPNTQTMRYEAIRDDALAMAMNINTRCPDSREKSLAITHLEDAVMWANASIARNE